jgi:hypothetical protein
VDPNEVLRRLRQARHAVQQALDTGQGDLAAAARLLVEHTEALDNWLTADGFPPDEWARPHMPSRRERNQKARRGHEHDSALSTIELLLAREAEASVRLDHDPREGTYSFDSALDGPLIDGTHGLLPSEEQL